MSVFRNILIANKATRKMCMLPLLCALAIASTSSAAVNRKWTSNYDESFDAVLNKIQKYGSEMGLEPLDLPDINRNFSVPVLFGKLNGDVKNTKGVLTGASVMKRSGNVTVRTDGKILYAEADVDFVSLNYNYASHVDYMGLAANGKTYGVINDLVLHLTLKVDLSNTNQAEEELGDLIVKNTGSVTVQHDSGLGIMDQLNNAISDVFTKAFKDAIVDSVRPEMKKAIESIIKKVENSEVA